MKGYLISFLCAMISFCGLAQGFSISGQLTVKGDKGKKSPAVAWTVTLNNGFMTTTTNQNGEYCFEHVPRGLYTIEYKDPFGLQRVYQTKVTQKDVNLNQTFCEDCSDYFSQAERDIMMGRPVIHIMSGEALVIHTGEHGYQAFLEKFGVEINLWGCIIPCDPYVFAKYNKIIFDYLDETFGDEWRSGKWYKMFKNAEGFNY